MQRANPDKSPQKYIKSLNQQDVICGRGSGPNENLGNIKFRRLILCRKAEYLAATTHEAKGRIANDIVQNIRSLGGRFLKKLTSEKLKNEGFERDMVVYEVVDELTALEKTKQTLRQNRAEFEAANDGFGKKKEAKTITAVDKETSSLSELETSSVSPQSIQTSSVVHFTRNQKSSNNGLMSWNPIPLDEASLYLDSSKLPIFGSSTVNILQQSLFTSSNDMFNIISSQDVTDLTQSPQSNSNFFQQVKVEQLHSIGDKMLGQCSLDIDFVDILSFILGSERSAMSIDTAEAFESLIKKYSIKDEMPLIKECHKMKEKYEQIFESKDISPISINSLRTLANDYDVSQTEFFANNSMESMQPILKNDPNLNQNQQQKMSEFSSDVFSSLVRQYFEEPVLFGQQSEQHEISQTNETLTFPEDKYVETLSSAQSQTPKFIVDHQQQQEITLSPSLQTQKSFLLEPKPQSDSTSFNEEISINDDESRV